MSYILEALRKAERERNPAQPDQPQAITRPRFVQISSLQQLRPYRPILVAGLCLSLMIALVILLVMKDRHATTPTTVVPVAAIPAPAPAAQLANTMAMTQMYGDGRGPATLDDLMDAGSEPVTDEASLYSNVGSVGAPGAFSDPSPIADVPVPEEATAPSQPLEPVPTAPAAPTTSVERMQLDPAPQPQIPKLRDMPSDYRAAFPVISLDVHSYDNASKKRFIMIAGKRYNEGDALAEGPRIAQIIPEGVVFDFRGEQVLFTIVH